ncbi:hypothetical protein [Macrococcus animalis]
MKIKTFALTDPNKTFKSDSIEELVEQFDKQVNVLVSAFQYFVTVVF